MWAVLEPSSTEDLQYTGTHPVLHSGQQPEGCLREKVFLPSGILSDRQKQCTAQTLQSSLCFAVAEACSLAGKGNDSSLKLLELDMDLLQTKDLAEIFFLFFFNALADGEYALSIEKLPVFEGNGCLQC